MVHGLLDALGSLIHHQDHSSSATSFVDLVASSNPVRAIWDKNPGVFHGRAWLDHHPTAPEAPQQNLAVLVGRAKEAMTKVREMLAQRQSFLDAQQQLQAALQESKANTEAVATASKTLGWPVEARLNEACVSPGAAFLFLPPGATAEKLQISKSRASQHASWSAFLS